MSGIIRRAYDICSTDEALQTELAFIKKVFTEINGYPKFLVDRMLQKFREMQTEAETSENNNTSDEIPPEEEADKKQTLILKVPFRGDRGQTLIKSLENTLKRTIENKINYRIVHTGTKLSIYFSLKDKVKVGVKKANLGLGQFGPRSTVVGVGVLAGLQHMVVWILNMWGRASAGPPGALA